jgi:nitrite reductase (NO-forming)
MTSFRFLVLIIVSLIFLSSNGLSQNSDTGGLVGYEIGVQADIDNLPRVKQKLVSPPFVPDHEQVATGGPKIVEIEFIIEEKEIEVAPEAFVQAMTYNGSVVLAQ